MAKKKKNKKKQKAKPQDPSTSWPLLGGQLEYRPSHLRALRYMGSKKHNSKVNGWINDRIGPTPKGFTWFEPFCGMADMTLSRPPADNEWLNDRDSMIINWWYVIQNKELRLHLEEFLKHSPRASRAMFLDAKEIFHGIPAHEVWEWLQQNQSLIVHAWAMTYVMTASLLPTTLKGGQQWAPILKGRKGDNFISGEMLNALGERMRNVHLDNRDAIELLRSVEDKDYLHIYVDPPYPGTGAYRSDVNQIELDATLLRQNSMVAVSGFDGDRPELEAAGWHKHVMTRTKKTFNPKSDLKAKGKKGTHLETLWMNYQGGQGVLF